MDTKFLEELKKLSSSVGHDLKAPLRAIKFYSELLHEDIPEDYATELKPYIEKLKSSSERLDLLVQEQNIIIKGLLGRIEPEEVELAKLVSEVGTEMEVALILNIDNSTVQSSSYLLRLILKEIFENVRCHCPANSLVKISKEGSVLKIADDGNGLHPSIPVANLFKAGLINIEEKQAYGLYFCRRAAESTDLAINYFNPGKGFGIEIDFSPQP